MSDFCKCGALRRPGQRNCLACHSASMKKHREAHKLTGEARRKMICRSYANVYLRRGKLVKEPCSECGNSNSQMHHHDYSKPLEIQWLCRPCHLAEHEKT